MKLKKDKALKDYLGNYDLNTEVGYCRAIDFLAGFQAAHDIMQSQIDELVEALKRAKEMNDHIFEKGNVNWGGTFVRWDIMNEGLLAVDRALAKHRTEKD